MTNAPFCLTAVEALPEYHLRLSYADGKIFDVDLARLIDTSTVLTPIKDTKLFSQAKIGFAGRSVDWIEDEIDLSADNLRHIAVEQTGEIGHERIWTWLHETGLTNFWVYRAERSLLIAMAKNPFPARSG